MSTNNHRLVVAATLAGGLCAPLSAQERATVVSPQEEQGLLTGIALGIHLDQGNAAEAARMNVRSAGVISGTLGPWSAGRFGGVTADHPDYSPRALFRHWVPELYNQPESSFNANVPLYVPELGGVSTGGDVMPRVTSAGVISFASPSVPAWYSLSFTVDDQAVGVVDEPPGYTSAIAQTRAATQSDAAGWVYSYTAEGSSVTRPELVDTVRAEYTRNQTGIGGLQPSASEISGVDWGMGIVSSSASGSWTVFQPIRDTIYFTLSRDWWNTYGQFLSITFDDPNSPGTTVTAQLATDTVYYMEWVDQGTTFGWTDPKIAMTPAQLFGSPNAALGVAIDALSVHRLRNDGAHEPTQVVFSLEAGDEINDEEANQILVSQQSTPSASGVATVYAESLKAPGFPGGTEITFKAGLVDGSDPGSQPDDVKGLCGRDPDEHSGYDTVVGYPVEDTNTPDDVDISLAMMRVETPGDEGKVDEDTVISSIVLAAGGLEVDAGDMGLLVFEYQIPDQSTPQLPVTFVAENEFPAMVVSADESVAELNFKLPPSVGGELRFRARFYLLSDILGGNLAPELSWPSILSL